MQLLTIFERFFVARSFAARFTPPSNSSDSVRLHPVINHFVDWYGGEQQVAVDVHATHQAVHELPIVKRERHLLDGGPDHAIRAGPSLNQASWMSLSELILMFSCSRRSTRSPTRHAPRTVAHMCEQRGERGGGKEEGGRGNKSAL